MKKILSLVFIPVAVSIASPQVAGYPDFEIVESIPMQTMLDNADVRNTEEVWVEMIDGAKTSVDFEEFYISDRPGESLANILKSIFAATKRGVKVRFIVDAGMYKTYPATVDSLARSEDISVRIIDFRKLAGGIQHAKYFIVDDKEVFIGSQNFDWRAMNQIHELGVKIRNRHAVRVYRDVFDLDWSLAEKNDPDMIGAVFRRATYSMPIQIIEAPGDTLRFVPTCSPLKLIPDTSLWDEPNIVKLINDAKHEVALQFLTYSPLTRGKGFYTVLNDALVRAANRGVQVKLIVSDWEKSPRQVEQLKELASIANIEIKFSVIPDLPDRYIPFARVEHCKYIVTDSAECWIGSSNAEKSYFYDTRNVGVMVWNSRVARVVRRIFLKDWNGPYTELVSREKRYQPREHGER